MIPKNKTNQLIRVLLTSPIQIFLLNVEPVVLIIEGTVYTLLARKVNIQFRFNFLLEKLVFIYSRLIFLFSFLRF